MAIVDIHLSLLGHVELGALQTEALHYFTLNKGDYTNKFYTIVHELLKQRILPASSAA